jgi:hypothetical protein
VTADAAAAALCARLVTLRAETLDRLAEGEHLDAGLLALVGNTSAALAALDTAETVVPVSVAERAVLADDGQTVRLVLYRGPDTVGAVELDSVRCVVLAQRLLDAAARRL